MLSLCPKNKQVCSFNMAEQFVEKLKYFNRHNEGNV